MSHILVVANETVAGRPLIDRVESIAGEGDRVTVLAPVHAPRSGYVVYDDSVCIVDMSRYFNRFNRYQSCGKCFPCRIGTKSLLEMTDRIGEKRRWYESAFTLSNALSRKGDYWASAALAEKVHRALHAK